MLENECGFEFVLGLTWGEQVLFLKSFAECGFEFVLGLTWWEQVLKIKRNGDFIALPFRDPSNSLLAILYVSTVQSRNNFFFLKQKKEGKEFRSAATTSSKRISFNPRANVFLFQIVHGKLL